MKVSLTLRLLLLATTLSSLSLAEDKFEPEPGFKLLLNGKNLDGWKTKAGDSLGGGKSEAFNGRFKMVDGELVIDPQVKGDVIIQTVGELAKDLHLKFDFQPGKGCNNDLFFRGVKFDLKSDDVKNLKQDEWNTFEMIVRGESMEIKNNGETIKTVKAPSQSSPLGLRAEFGAMKVRRLRVRLEE
jgi:hypothetical protein